VMVGRRHRYLPVGWFWFLGTLVPMIGIIQVGIQAMADRYAYVSFLGLFIMICWGVADWAQEKQLPAALLPAISCLVLLTLGVTTRHQLDYWRTDVALWTHTLQVTSRNSVAESELGTALAIDGRVEEAVPHFYNAIAIAPSDYLSHMGIGIYEMQRRNYAAALEQYKEVVKNQNGKPNVLMHAYSDMARAYRALGDNEQAQACLQQASKLRSQ
jgi:tetratricopeptide (TPR) repeat protein